MIRLLIADDHAIIRQGLRALIEKACDIELVAECADGADALDMIGKLLPDIALLDISMPEIDGLKLADIIVKMNYPTRVIILTTHEDPLLYEIALKVGTHGYMLKSNAFEELLSTIRNVAAGRRVMPVPANSMNQDHVSITLTDREREVLSLISHGLTNRMIAETLSISIKTVDHHRSNVMMKLGLHSTAELVRYAYQTGLV